MLEKIDFSNFFFYIKGYNSLLVFLIFREFFMLEKLDFSNFFFYIKGYNSHLVFLIFRVLTCNKSSYHLLPLVLVGIKLNNS